MVYHFDELSALKRLKIDFMVKLLNSDKNRNQHNVVITKRDCARCELLSSKITTKQFALLKNKCYLCN